MRSCEKHITRDSDYYIYSPSLTGAEMFFYPLYTGRFTYKGGYRLYRDNYDSYLLMYIEKGELTLELDGKTKQAQNGCFVLVDCYRPHAYFTAAGCECIWCHFDGPTARAHYCVIAARMGNIFTLADPYPVVTRLNQIYQAFRNGDVIREPLMSKYLTDILTAILCAQDGSRSDTTTGMAEEIISYISEHFTENITVGQLAGRAGLSTYHFIRSFRKETGFTPHEYLINTRLNTARYLLKNSRLPIKDICFNSGFSCESVFCSAFKKHAGLSPSQYRSQNDGMN